MVAGCTSPVKRDQTDVAAIYQDPVYLHLQESVTAIQDSANRLAAVEQARYRDETGKEATLVDSSLVPGLEKHVSLGADWHGPLDALVKKLAAVADGGWDMAPSIGIRPSAGVIVHVNTDYRRIIDILQDAGTQAGSRAQLHVMSRQRVLQIEYPAL
ncbi:hypothetical protein A3709_19565 [Halioglobus sp. HI00S01]|nr:hypothetical protein A3709_19565 [Halioglobus sp. HI00S01]